MWIDVRLVTFLNKMYSVSYTGLGQSPRFGIETHRNVSVVSISSSLQCDEPAANVALAVLRVLVQGIKVSGCLH